MITNDELRLKVRQIINEMHDDSAVTLLSDDTRSIDEHIAALLPDAVLWIQRNKGWGSLNPKDATDAEVKDNGDGTGEITLPEDFVKLIALRMEGWQRPCSRCIHRSRQLLPRSIIIILVPGAAVPSVSSLIMLPGVWYYLTILCHKRVGHR